MCSKIMVPLDGSRFSEQSLRYAYQVAGHMGAQLHLVKVHMPVALAGDVFAGSLQIDRVSKAAEEAYLLETRERYVQTEAVTAVLKGPVVDALRSYIDDQGIDLVIMTTHGRGGLSRAWLGSVADQLVRRVNVPILLLRPQKGEATRPGPRFDLDRVVIPLDGSKEAERAIAPAVIGSPNNCV
jgi:nucleotide-binding universal stress UspA family protein